ncbi:LptA/OstA family protein [Synechococcus sp. OH2]|uniref:LptA/OstA family protein n=1 Tax=Synechococcus sp. OH2 TaxID=136798 RepID=UPI0039C0D448
MRRFFNSNLGVALLGTGLLAALVAWALSIDIEEVKVESPPPDQPLSVSRRVDIVGRRGGHQRWRLIAEQVELRAGQQVFEQGAHGYFYGGGADRQEEVPDPFFASSEQMTWWAKRARYDATADALYLDEEVEVRSEDGSLLLTRALRVTPEERIEVPAEFTLKGQEMVLQGRSGSFNFQFALLSAQQGKLIMLPPDRPSKTESSSSAQGADLASAARWVATAAADPASTTITADQITYDRANQVAEGRGNLRIRERGIEIRAPQGTYLRQQAQSILSGGVVLQEVAGDTSRDPLLADLRLAQAGPQATPNQPDQEVTIIADRLTYDRNTQVARGEGNLEIQQGETIIQATQGTYRRRESQSLLTGGVTLREPGRVLTSARLEGNHRDKIFFFEENVLYRQMAASTPAPGGGSLTEELRQAETEVRAARLVYNSRTGTSEFSDAVEFIQRGRKAKANQATITPEKVELRGEVVIEQIEGDWLARRLQNPQTQADVDQPTVIYADRVEIDQASGDARFLGNVVIVQANRAIEGDRADYSDQGQIFRITADQAPVLLCDRGELTPVPPKTSEGLPGRDALDQMCRGANRLSGRLVTLNLEQDEYTVEGDEQQQGMFQFRITDAL